MRGTFLSEELNQCKSWYSRMTFGCNKWQTSSLMRGLANPVDINGNDSITESLNPPVPVSVKLAAVIQTMARMKSGEGRKADAGRSWKKIFKK